MGSERRFVGGGGDKLFLVNIWQSLEECDLENEVKVNQNLTRAVFKEVYPY